MGIELIDTHAHLGQEEFDADRAEVIARAHAAGVTRIIAIGTTAATSAAAVRLAAEHDSVWAAVGIQPNYCAQAAPGDWDTIVALARQPKVVAIGETGLDRYWDYTPFDVQQDYFDRHLRLARELDLPFVVHMRECSRDILAMLRASVGWAVPTSRREDASGREGPDGANGGHSPPYVQCNQPNTQRGPLRGVMHSFTLDSPKSDDRVAGAESANSVAGAESAKPRPDAATFDVLDEFLALGLHISFAGMVTYKKSDALREVARRVPADRILVETDSPYLSPEPLRGKRNEPAHVVHTARRLAEVRGQTLEEFAHQSTANTLQLFWPGDTT